MSIDITRIVQKMIDASESNAFDIHHFMKVYAYAHIIGLSEGLEERMQQTVEIAALVHDIAVPLCRAKYGSTNGRLQEKEGAPLARAFLQEFDLPQEMLSRIVYLIGHHHSYFTADGIDYQILLEADFITVAGENSKFTKEDIRQFGEAVFRTEMGLHLLRSIYLPEDLG